ncbi:MAG: DUF3575 domain-containing protein [Flavobacteriaceae bacterium]
MKNTLSTLFFFFLGTLFVFSQETETTDDAILLEKKHEFRIDALEGLIFPAIDLSYEYVINKFSGAGISVFINLEDTPSNYQNFALTPYYRQYLFNKKEYGARGFFAEGVLQYSTGSEETYFFENGADVFRDEKWNAFGIGFAIGQKWVSKNGFIIEISAGGGRNFGDEAIVPDGFFRGGILVGYRF